MPELPEVETVRRHLTEGIEGATVISVEVGHPRTARRQPNPADLVDRLVGRRVEKVGRRGKFLMIDVGDFTWVIHLGMSGRVSLDPPDSERTPHTHLVVGFDTGVELRLIDPRTFGFTAVYTDEEIADSPLRLLGADVWEQPLTAAELGARLKGRTAPIKPLLLDQRIVAGLGNIYADEALFRAGIKPHRPGGSLDEEDIARLVEAIPPVVAAALADGGTSLGDLAYLLPDGRAGEHLDRLAVYGRAGEPCRRCGTPIERAVLRDRSTHWCPVCQR